MGDKRKPEVLSGLCFFEANRPNGVNHCRNVRPVDPPDDVSPTFLHPTASQRLGIPLPLPKPSPILSAYHT
jgi:hypothetical protein